MAVRHTYVENQAKLSKVSKVSKVSNQAKQGSNPFFFTGQQNVNKPKSRAARTVYGLIFLPFYNIIVSFFLCQDGNKTRSNCTNRLQIVKETQTNTA